MTALPSDEPTAERVRCRDRQGRRAWIEVYSDRTGNVILRMPDGERYELEPLEGVGRLRGILRDQVLGSFSVGGARQ